MIFLMRLTARFLNTFWLASVATLICLFVWVQLGVCGLTISVDKEIYAPGETIIISTSIDASQIKVDRGDLAVLRIGLDARIIPVLVERNWVVADRPPAEMATFSMKEKDIGVFSWLFVLCYPGKDPIKVKNWLAAAATTAYVLPADTAFPPEKQASFFVEPPKSPVLIAHGGGEYQGQTVSNTKEALDYNYTKGHRYFEVDLNWTSDSHLVLVHDWQYNYKALFTDAAGIPSLKEFESKCMKAGTTQLSLVSLYRWLRRHPNAIIITDVKRRNVDALARISKTAGVLGQRFIAQIYEPSELEPVRALGFHKIILTLYRINMDESQILTFLRNHKIFAITLSVRKAFAFFNLRNLKNTGVRLYVHTINHPKVLHYFRQLGVDGV